MSSGQEGEAGSSETQISFKLGLGLMEVARHEPCERAGGERALQWECESDARVRV